MRTQCHQYIRTRNTCSSINRWSVSCSKGPSKRRSSSWQRDGSKNVEASIWLSGIVKSATNSFRTAQKLPSNERKKYSKISVNYLPCATLWARTYLYWNSNIHLTFFWSSQVVNWRTLFLLQRKQQSTT